MKIETLSASQDFESFYDHTWLNCAHQGPLPRVAAEEAREVATGLGEVIIQARKTYVSLVSRRRTFARVQATTNNRVDLGLRLEGQKLVGRLQPSRIHETMRFQISLTAPGDVDSEALDWLQKAYDQNR